MPASEGATEVTTVDIVEGTGAAVEADQTAVIQLVLFRGDNSSGHRQHLGRRADPGADAAKDVPGCSKASRA